MSNDNNFVFVTIVYKLISLVVRLSFELISSDGSIGYRLDLFQVFNLEVRYTNILNETIFN